MNTRNCTQNNDPGDLVTKAAAEAVQVVQGRTGHRGCIGHQGPKTLTPHLHGRSVSSHKIAPMTHPRSIATNHLSESRKYNICSPFPHAIKEELLTESRPTVPSKHALTVCV